MSFSDNFNRATLGSNWATVEGTAWVTASSLYLKPSQIFVSTSVRVVGSFPNDQFAEVWTEITTTGTQASAKMGPCVRMDASGSCYFAFIGPSDLALYKRAGGGTDTYLTDVAITTTTDTLTQIRLTVTGTTLNVSLGGVSKITFTDATYTAGNPGCHVLTNDAPGFPRFDDFLSTDVSGGGSSVPVLAANAFRRRRGDR